MLVRRHVRQHRTLTQLVDQPVRPHGQLIRVRVFERVLVLRATHAIFHREVLQGLQKTLNPVDLRDFRLQPPDHIAGAGGTLLAIAQVDLDAAAVQRHIGAVHAR